MIILGDERVASGMVQAGLGTYLSVGSGVAAVIAGLIGLISPDKK